MSDTPINADPFNCPDCGSHDYGLYAPLFGVCPHCMKRENAALRHDIERHVKIASDLATELEQVRKDAERYRHLRDHGGADLFGGTASMSIGKHPMIVYFAPSLNHANMVSLFAENADYMVDAAIAQGKGEK